MTQDDAAQVDDAFRRAVVFHRQSRVGEARALYEKILRIEPRHFQALHLLGIIALQGRHPEAALELIGRALAVDPSNAAAHVNYGNALHERGRFEEAVAAHDRAIALKPDCAEAFLNRGNALRALGRHDCAIDSYERAVAVKPDYVDAYINRGLALSELKRHEAAIASYDQAINLRPDHPDPHFNQGNELRQLGNPAAAVASYEKALSLRPGFVDALLNLSVVLVGLRRYSEALTNVDKALALNPDCAEAHFNRGGVLLHLGRFEAAVASYDAAIALRPTHAEAHGNRGQALRELKRYEAAVASYDRALAQNPDAVALRAAARHIKMQVADWDDFAADVCKIDAGIRGGAGAPNPFYVLTLSDSAALQRQAAESWVRQECPSSLPLTGPPQRKRGDRIHVGYFSADFHDHATSYLIVQLLELHDRSRFRVTAFSFGPDSQSPMRRRLVAGCDEFVDVRRASDAEIAGRARHMGIDIAVDLKGFTQDYRAGTFALRAAPVQVNYLGYPGTTGAPYMDYLIADRVLVPAESRAHHREKIVYLPDSYQPNDATRAIAEKRFSRAELGLPPNGCVFCCFNNTYKILPATFDCWMRILLRVPDSVLWLLGDNPTAMRNLRREAAARGVDPQRLIFADRIDLPHHLARHRAADLFLDTWPCNAHTTASDALWAGVPVLTCPGEAFASRVAASLLTAIGLTELIASSVERYEELAVHLATHCARLADLRRHLNESRLNAPLFDAPRYARHLDAAFSEMYERQQAGLPPEHIEIAADRPYGRP